MVSVKWDNGNYGYYRFPTYTIVSQFYRILKDGSWKQVRAEDGDATGAAATSADPHP